MGRFENLILKFSDIINVICDFFFQWLVVMQSTNFKGENFLDGKKHYFINVTRNLKLVK